MNPKPGTSGGGKERVQRGRDGANEAAGDDQKLSSVAAAIGEPARARMLCLLLDKHARPATELAMVAEVSASTASAHLQKLLDQHLVRVAAHGKHRYYSLAGANVARALESLGVIAADRDLRGRGNGRFVPSTPSRLRGARTCYDHIAGRLGVALHDRMLAMGWLSRHDTKCHGTYGVTARGEAGFAALGIDLEAARGMRRRFAFACLDWSERRPHLAGGLGAALLDLALRKKWVVQDLDSRALEMTSRGRREIASWFGLKGFDNY